MKKKKWSRKKSPGVRLTNLESINVATSLGSHSPIQCKTFHYVLIMYLMPIMSWIPSQKPWTLHKNHEGDWNLIQGNKSILSGLYKITSSPIVFPPSSCSHHHKLQRERLRFSLHSPEREQLMDFKVQNITHSLLFDLKSNALYIM